MVRCGCRVGAQPTAWLIVMGPSRWEPMVFRSRAHKRAVPRPTLNLPGPLLHSAGYSGLGSRPDRVPGFGVAGWRPLSISGRGRIGQMNMAGNPTTGSSLKVAMVSGVM
jgi:hypothetical protein